MCKLMEEDGGKLRSEQRIKCLLPSLRILEADSWRRILGRDSPGTEARFFFLEVWMTQPSFGMNHCGTLDEEDGKIKEENINGAARKCQVSTRFESLAFISLFLSLSLSLSWCCQMFHPLHSQFNCDFHKGVAFKSKLWRQSERRAITSKPIQGVKWHL